MEIKCESCGQVVEATMGNMCPHCGNKLNNAPKKKSVGTRFKDFLARFRKARTVAEWKHEAQEAMKSKEFVVGSLRELRRCEEADKNQGMQQQMQQQQTPQRQGGYGYQQQQMGGYGGAQYQQQGYGAQQSYGYPQQQRQPVRPQPIQQPKEKNKVFTQATLKDLLDVVAKEQKMS